MNGFEDRVVLAQVGARHDAEAADEACAEVRHDVAVQIWQEQHVELLGVHDEVHAGGVHDAFFVRDVRVPLGHRSAHSMNRPSLSFMMLAL